jgi:hypothetical protein
MKKILPFLILLITLSIRIIAQNISIETAKTAGSNFLNQQGAENINLELIQTKTDGNQVLYYIFNFNHGFIIVSGDDRVVPILGYSTETSWIVPTDTIVGSNVMGWLENYGREILFTKSLNLPQSSTVGTQWNELLNNTPPANIPALTPLLTTTWNQDWPYNELCPANASGSGGHTLVGSVGVAMAQIMKYWGNPATGLGSYSYTQAGYGTISANFGATTYNWGAMPNSISSSNPEVATICYHAAVSAGSYFGINNTNVGWTGDQEPMTKAFINFFKYAFSSIQYVSKYNYSDTNWENLIKNELDASRPVFYRGNGTSYHAWVCDGYQGTNYFHMNWGWGGQYDGYFYLSALNPGGNNYTNNQQAIIGIKPNDGSTILANTTWSGSNSMTSRIAVADGITLTITPGAVITFPQGAWLQIYGTLNAVGLQADSVVFTSADTNLLSRWNGIVLDNEFMNRSVMNDNDTTRLIYCKVQYTKSSGLLLRYINKIWIDHSRFLRCATQTEDGGAIQSKTSVLTVQNSTLERCSTGLNGGAISIQHETPTSYRIFNNKFLLCSAPYGFGGGLSLINCNQNAIISGNTFNLCNAVGGAALFCQLGTSVIISNNFSNNTASGGGGAIYISYSSPRFTNNLVSNNYATEEGGGLLIDNSSNPVIYNNSVVNNSSGILGGGFNFAANSNPVFKNNIIYGNTSSTGNQISLNTTDCDPSFYYCDIQGGKASFGGSGAGSNYSGIYQNNLSSNPSFVAPSGGSGAGFNGLTANWQLQLGSPCRDTGTPDTTGLALPVKDVYGNPRIANTRVDIGASEYPCMTPTQPSLINGPAMVCSGSTGQVYTVTAIFGINYEWSYSGTGATIVGGQGSGSITVNYSASATSGIWTVTPANECATGTPRSLSVTLLPVPFMPSVISGNTSPEQFSSQTYSVTNTPGINYLWTLPDGWVQTDGGTTYSITVTVGTTPGSIVVTPTNGACTGPSRSLAVTPHSLFVSPITWAAPGTAGSANFTVICNTSWTASSNQPWCTVTPSGTGNGTIVANLTANPSTTQSRTANITASSSGLPSVTVTIIQSGTQYKVLNIKAFLEGLYFGGGIMHAVMDENGPHFGSTIADHVTVELHDTVNYSNIVYVKNDVVLSIAGNIAITDIPAVTNSRYRITIKHRNSIETTSRYGVSFSGNSVIYDFTTGAAKAYGNNLQVISGRYNIYCGDVNQDGLVDSSDIGLIDNANTTVQLGYTSEDVNGDGLVDSTDMLIADNNNTAVIIAQTP